MDQRYGAWAQLLVLFRMIHDGAESGAMRLPKRHGVLFDPDRFKFLEGRSIGDARQIHERIEPPLVPDGTIYRALKKLLVLVVVLGEQHLRRVLTAYFAYYHRSRTHLSLAKDAPTPRCVQGVTEGDVITFREVGGLHHRYERRAA